MAEQEEIIQGQLQQRGKKNCNEGRLRHYCRNPRCRSKLTEPVDSDRRAFCSRGCHATYYRHRCVVCEKPITRTTETKRLCGSSKCAYAHKQDPEAYRFQGRIGASTPRSASETPIKWVFKSGVYTARGWRWNDTEDDHELVNPFQADGDGYLITHPQAHPAQRAATLEGARELAISLALASLPLAQATAGRVARDNARRKENPKAIVQRHTLPFNLIGGSRPSDASMLDANVVQTVIASERRLAVDYVEDAPPLAWCVRHHRLGGRSCATMRTPSRRSICVWSRP